MAFLYLPNEVWQYILYEWITFSGVIRFDCAASFQPDARNSLNYLYAGHEFILTGRCLQTAQLLALAKWVDAKNAPLHRLELNRRLTMELPVWDEMWKLMCKRIRGIAIQTTGDWKNCLQSAAQYCENLLDLDLRVCNVDNQFLQSLLVRSARTLQCLQLGSVYGKLCEFPEMSALQVTEFGHYGTNGVFSVPLLSSCSQLIALNFDGGFAGISLAPTIAAYCVKLQRLRISFEKHQLVEGLRIVASKCTLIEYLELRYCNIGSGVELGNVLQGMVNLRTVSCKHDNAQQLVTLVTHASPTLRTLSIDNSFTTVASIRAITAAQPNLTMLYLYVPPHDFTDDNVLEHCTALQCFVLRCAAHDDKSVLAVLLSAVLHCPQLHTVCIKDCPINMTDQFMPVKSMFPNLRKLSLPCCPLQACATTAASLSNPGLIITDVDVPFPDWMPFA